jgi:hypothetical protein
MLFASQDADGRLGRLRERWSDPLLTGLTVLLAFMMFVVAPLQATGIVIFQAFQFILALVIIGGVYIISGSRIATVLLLVALVLAAMGAAFRLKTTSTLNVYLFAGAWLIMGTTLIWAIGRAVFSPGRVTYHRIMGAILLYLSIAATFVALFAIVGLHLPNAFSGLSVEDSPALASNLIYFSFVTLTSTGYGDIFPVHPVARSLCNLETIIGQLYPATLLARLVTLEIEGRR